MGQTGSQRFASNLTHPNAFPRGSQNVPDTVGVGIQNIEAWIGRNGCGPHHNPMGNTVTAEICCTQVRLSLHRGAQSDDGRIIDTDLYSALVYDNMEYLREFLGSDRHASGRCEDAVRIIKEVATPPDLIELLTVPAYTQVAAIADAGF